MAVSVEAGDQDALPETGRALHRPSGLLRSDSRRPWSRGVLLGFVLAAFVWWFAPPAVFWGVLLLVTVGVVASVDPFSWDPVEKYAGIRFVISMFAFMWDPEVLLDRGPEEREVSVPEQPPEP